MDYCPVTGFCEHGKEMSGSKKVSNYQLSKDDAVPKSKLLVDNRFYC